MLNDVPVFNSFKELLFEICWSFEYPKYDIIKHSDGGYSLNKLYIDRDRVSYKTENWTLAPGVFEEFEKFYEFLQTTEHHPIKEY